MFYFAVCMNILFSLLLAQLVKYDVHTTCKIKFIHALIIIVLYIYQSIHITGLQNNRMDLQWSVLIITVTVVRMWTSMAKANPCLVCLRRKYAC